MPSMSKGIAAHGSGYEQNFSLDFYFANFRRIAPAKPISPVPSRMKLDGSGVAEGTRADVTEDVPVPICVPVENSNTENGEPMLK